ncbi:Lipin/Ned1/Smp2-domain-containing protein [Phyllosticta citrichinensis]|uniref:Lipin/Ned1/Smp2-domain-containing protein n=1 Tax=Phyllosticta citrichinensis TaxID=1130410 RepID=A0ABR1XR04_9PEZI
MQYVRGLGSSVSKTWNSINPATLSGAIDVIVVEHEDGSLACSPFHVRFGKFSLLRPFEKKVEFKVNGVKQDYAMKLGEGGEAFFVFETSASIPESLQTSPLVSPAQSPEAQPAGSQSSDGLSEPEPLDLATDGHDEWGRSRAMSDLGDAVSPTVERSSSGDWSQTMPRTTQRPQLDFDRAQSDALIPSMKHSLTKAHTTAPPVIKDPEPGDLPHRSTSPPPVSHSEAVARAMNLSKKLWTSNIPSQVTESGDLMLDMTGYKSSKDNEEHALRAEVLARKILAEELEGNYDIGSLISADEKGNLWIYSSEEAKDAATRKHALTGLNPEAIRSSDAISDPGYHSDEAGSDAETEIGAHHSRRDSDSGVGLPTPPKSPEKMAGGDSSKNYAKTLRLTNEQLQALKLKSGENTMTFTVNRATCQASIYYWRHNVPVVISDIDGTITKSDALGHVLNMLGRDWTHLGVAKLYTDIATNGYNLLYLTSRSVGQADTTRAYLNGVVQEGYRLPKGPVIMSPDRTMAALRREVYLRKPEVFKMACLRDIMGLFNKPQGETPFYAGFGNRFTDALSYRSVNIPSTRIFTINANSEVSLDLLSLNKYKTGYTSMREIVDHFFPPVGLLVQNGAEEFTDFNYWRDKPLELDEFSASDSDEDEEPDETSLRSEDEAEAEDDEGDLEASYMSRDSIDETGHMEDSIMESVEGDVDEEEEDDEDTEQEEEDYEDDEEGDLEIDEEEALELDKQLDELDLDSDSPGPQSEAQPTKQDLKDLARALHAGESNERGAEA